MQRSIPILGVALLTLGLTACSSGPAQPGPGATASKGSVTIGLMDATSGPWAGLGNDINLGFKTYLDQKGGVLGGFKIDLKMADPGNDTAQALTSARQLVERDKAQAVVGLINSALAYAVGPYMEKAAVPLVITGAGADGLTKESASPFIYRVGNSSSQPTLPLGQYACETLGYKTATVIALDYSFGWEAAGGFARGYTDAGCKIKQEIYAPTGTQNWSAYVGKISKDVDVVAMAVPGADGVRLLRDYRGFGVKQPIVAYGGTVDQTVLPSEGATAEGIISTFGYSTTLDTAANKKFVDAVGKSANAYTEDGYAAAAAVEAALDKISGPADAAAIKDALKGLSFTSARGKITFDKYGQGIFTMYVRKVVKDGGSYVNKVIDSIPDVSQFWTIEDTKYLQLPSYESLKGKWSSQ